MKINIANPSTGAQKKYLIEEDSKLRALYDKRLAMEVEGDALGDEFKGYVFKIMGGQDKQGFPMKQGVQVPGRVKLLMTPGEKCFLGHGRKKGERRRKAVRGCIISTDLSVLNLVIVKRGEADIPGLTDTQVPKLRGPKRASNIRKLFLLNKGDDVRAAVKIYRHTWEKDGKQMSTGLRRIQRLVTPQTVQRKRHIRAVKKNKLAKAKAEAAEYHKLIQLRLREARERRSESLAKRRAQRSASQTDRS